MEKYFNRSSTPLNLQDRMEQAFQLYTTANRGASNKGTFRMELDARLRWCSLVWEQNDVKVWQRNLLMFRYR